MERACQNAEKIAIYLKNHPKVSKVYYPGFTTHPGHEIAKIQMRMFGGMVSFDLLNNNENFEKMSKLHNPYGDGLASKRIVDFIKKIK